MKWLFIRIVFIMLPIGYMAFIWLQTSYFDPESVSILLPYLSMPIIMLIGTAMELAHLFEFGFLYFLIIVVFLSFGELSKWKEWTALIISLLYGIVDEIHQIYIPFRSASFVDLFKNTIGIVIMWWIIQKYYFKNKGSILGRLLRKITTASTGI